MRTMNVKGKLIDLLSFWVNNYPEDRPYAVIVPKGMMFDDTRDVVFFPITKEPSVVENGLCSSDLMTHSVQFMRSPKDELTIGFMPFEDVNKVLYVTYEWLEKLAENSYEVFIQLVLERCHSDRITGVWNRFDNSYRIMRNGKKIDTCYSYDEIYEAYGDIEVAN
jgi:hypothetical protein